MRVNVLYYLVVITNVSCKIFLFFKMKVPEPKEISKFDVFTCKTIYPKSYYMPILSNIRIVLPLEKIYSDTNIRISFSPLEIYLRLSEI